MIVYEGKICPPPEGFIAIVVAKFNRTITQRLLDGALAKFKEHGVREKDIQVCWVPGAFELPLVAGRFANHPECLAVIALGAVIKGETSHDEHINRAVSMQLAQIGADTETPTIFGVLTCDTIEQAEARSGANAQSRDKLVDSTAGNKGAEAAEAALEMIDLLTEIPDSHVQGMDMFSSLLEEFGGGGGGNLLDGYDDYDEDESDLYDTGDEEVVHFVPRRKKKATASKRKSGKKR